MHHADQLEELERILTCLDWQQLQWEQGWSSNYFLDQTAACCESREPDHNSRILQGTDWWRWQRSLGNRACSALTATELQFHRTRRRRQTHNALAWGWGIFGHAGRAARHINTADTSYFYRRALITITPTLTARRRTLFLWLHARFVGKEALLSCKHLFGPFSPI